MKRLALLLTLLCAAATFAQTTLPNISYSATLSSTCASATGACAGGVVAGQGGVPALPQSNTGSLGNGSVLDVPVANYNAATITFSGTYSGATENFEFSDSTGGVYYFSQVCSRTDINLLGASDALPTNGQRAWQCPIWGAYRFRVRQSALSSGSVNVTITLTQAAIDPSLVVAASQTNIAGSNDPCQDAAALKSSVKITLTSTTAQELVTASAGKVIYVCGFAATIQGSATTVGTLQFEYGTKTTNGCDTGTTTLTDAFQGNITANVPTFIASPGGGFTQFASATSNELCAVATGTTISVKGYLTYVQQ